MSTEAMTSKPKKVDPRTGPTESDPASGSGDLEAEEEANDARSPDDDDDAVDQASKESFPASDPPPWTTGQAHR